MNVPREYRYSTSPLAVYHCQKCNINTCGLRLFDIEHRYDKNEVYSVSLPRKCPVCGTSLSQPPKKHTRTGWGI